MAISRTSQPAGPKGDQPDRIISCIVYAPSETVVLGDGWMIVRINPAINGWYLTNAGAHIATASATGSLSVNLRNSRTSQDMLTVPVTIDATENDSVSAAASPAVNSANAQVAGGDAIIIRITSVGAGTKGLIVDMTFSQTP